MDEEKQEWVSTPTISDLKNDLTNSQSYHAAHLAKIDEWRNQLNIAGAARVRGSNTQSTVQPKIIRKQAEWRYSSLSEPFLGTEDLFAVKPVSHEDRAAAEQNGLVLNHQFNTRINKTLFIDTLIRALVNEGTAIVRLGWNTATKKVEETEYEFGYREINPQEQELISIIQQAAQTSVQMPDSFNQISPEIKEAVRIFKEENRYIKTEIINEIVVEKEKTVVDEPTVELLNFEEVYIDPTCLSDITKANFIIHNFYTSLDELKKDGKYTNLDRVESKHNSADGLVEPNSIHVTNFFKDKPRQKFIVHEYWGYWDIYGTGKTVPIVMSWVGDIIIRKELNPYPDQKLPFVVIAYLPIKNSLYGESDGSLLIDNQKIIGAITRGVVDTLGKSANSQRGVSSSLLNATNRDLFYQGQDYEYNPTSGDPRHHIIEHTYPEIPNSALQLIQYMNTDAEALTGVKAFSTGGGITGEGLGKTATGVRGALDAASKRELGILRRISNGIIEIGNKITSMNGEFLDKEEIIRISNSEFIPIRKDNLQGSFDIKLSISTAESDAAKAQELAFMLQTMGGQLPSDMTNLILSEIARLHKMPDLAFAIKNYKPQPDPYAEKMKQLEIAKLEAETKYWNSYAYDKGSRGELNLAKINTETARTRSMDSTTIKKNLDTEERHQGISHNRDLELLNAKKQAEQIKQDSINKSLFDRDVINKTLAENNNAGN